MVNRRELCFGSQLKNCLSEQRQKLLYLTSEESCPANNRSVPTGCTWGWNLLLFDLVLNPRLQISGNLRCNGFYEGARPVWLPSNNPELCSNISALFGKVPRCGGICDIWIRTINKPQRSGQVLKYLPVNSNFT